MSELNEKKLSSEYKKTLRDAQDLIHKARIEDSMECLDKAEALLNKILNFKPDNIIAIFFMGCIHLIRKNPGMAEILFTIVYKADKKFINAANNLGIIYKNKEQRKKAVCIYLEAIETMVQNPKNIFPDIEDYNETLADLYGNLASCFTNNGTSKEALEYYEKSFALKDRIDRNTHRFNFSLACLELGDYKKGFENYKYYSIVHPEQRVKNYSLDEIPTPKWAGDKNQIVSVIGEQGLGDELMYASIIPDVAKEIKIIFDCHPRLQKLFKNSWPEIPIFGTRKDRESVWHGMVKPDAYIPISELCAYYRNDLKDFGSGEPFLKSDSKYDELLPEFFNKEKSRPRIGFSWTGGLINTNSIHRTIPYDLLFEILNHDCDFISLQYKSEDNDELLELAKYKNLDNIHIFQDVLSSYNATARMIEKLDFIICAPQSVVYLAGALGVKCYQLCPKRGMWQQGVYNENMPWFKSVINIWQKEFDDWAYCIQESKRIINDFINQ